MRSIQHVRSSYWDWFGNEQYLRERLPDILLIGLQKRLSDDFEWLKERLGLAPSVALPTADVAAHRNQSDIDKTLTSKAVDNLNEWYHADFEFITLCKQIVSEREGSGKPG